MNKATISIEELASKVLIKGESRIEFVTFCENLLQNMVVKNEIEKNLLEKYIFLYWKYLRSIRVERDLLNAQNQLSDVEIDVQTIFKGKKRRVRGISRININSPDIQNVLQLQFNLERSMHRTLDKLRSEQRGDTSKFVEKE